MQKIARNEIFGLFGDLSSRVMRANFRSLAFCAAFGAAISGRATSCGSQEGGCTE